MNNLKVNFYKFIGKVYIPSSLLNREEEIIMHISDTPITFFSPLETLIKNLKPEYIIHTGDLVDNLKLEHSKNLVTRYENSVKILLNILDNSNSKKNYITLGNHDNINIVKKYSSNSIISENTQTIKINNYYVKANHFCNELVKSPAKYNFYGHDLTLKTCKKDKICFFNGIMTINIITVNTGKIYTLPYPFGTDDMRLRRGRMGF